MKVLLDTNILLDYYTKRPNFFDNAEKIIDLCLNQEIEGVIASHSILNMHFILRKHYTSEQRSKLLLSIFKLFAVAEVDNAKIIEALENLDFKDFEDCLQSECARDTNADYIITRNKQDYEQSKIPALEPDEFLKLLK